MKRAGIVLAGGRSQRMGRPKALLPWFGRPLVGHVCASLAPCVDEVLVVTSRDLDLAGCATGARIVVDREPARGPLAALRDGLLAARADVAFVTATDSPCLTAAYVEAILAQAAATGRIVAPIADGHVQVLSAVYPGTAGREAAALLDAGFTSPLALLERSGFSALEAAPSDSTAVPWSSFNDPEGYLALARRLDPEASAEVEWRRPGAPTRVVGTPIGFLGAVLECAARGLGVGRGADGKGWPGSAMTGRAPAAVLLGEVSRTLPADAGLPVGPGDRVVVSSEEPPDLAAGLGC